jgi:hypothetical protein
MAVSPIKSVRIERQWIQMARMLRESSSLPRVLSGPEGFFVVHRRCQWDVDLAWRSHRPPCLWGSVTRAALGRPGPAFAQGYRPASACRYCEPSPRRCDQREPLPGELPLPAGNSEEPASGTGQSISRQRRLQFLWRRRANRSMRVRQINDGMKRLF